jgi:hypothetical protein
MSNTHPWSAAAATLSLMAASAAYADTFSAAHYDPKTDELVVTMIYGGTNPGHTFTLRWGKCEAPAAGDGEPQVSAQVLDSQWRDAARRDFTKTVRFSLNAVPCRPAEVTLHTAPRFYYSLHIPARPAGVDRPESAATVADPQRPIARAASSR